MTKFTDLQQSTVLIHWMGQGKLPFTTLLLQRYSACCLRGIFVLEFNLFIKNRYIVHIFLKECENTAKLTSILQEPLKQ